MDRLCRAEASAASVAFFFFIVPPPPRSTLFPYTTLFRSLLPICFQAVSAGQHIPVMAVTMLLAYLVARRFAPLFAVPVAMLFGVATLILLGGLESVGTLVVASQVTHPVWIDPSFDTGAVVYIGFPLLFVTMAVQNLPGIDMMRSCGYRFNARAALTACNIGGVRSEEHTSELQS